MLVLRDGRGLADDEFWAFWGGGKTVDEVSVFRSRPPVRCRRLQRSGDHLTGVSEVTPHRRPPARCDGCWAGWVRWGLRFARAWHAAAASASASVRLPGRLLRNLSSTLTTTVWRLLVPPSNQLCHLNFIYGCVTLYSGGFGFIYVTVLTPIPHHH